MAFSLDAYLSRDSGTTSFRHAVAGGASANSACDVDVAPDETLATTTAYAVARQQRALAASHYALDARIVTPSARSIAPGSANDGRAIGIVNVVGHLAVIGEWHAWPSCRRERGWGLALPEPLSSDLVLGDSRSRPQVISQQLWAGVASSTRRRRRP